MGMKFAESKWQNPREEKDYNIIFSSFYKPRPFLQQCKTGLLRSLEDAELCLLPIHLVWMTRKHFLLKCLHLLFLKSTIFFKGQVTPCIHTYALLQKISKLDLRGVFKKKLRLDCTLLFHCICNQKLSVV